MVVIMRSTKGGGGGGAVVKYLFYIYINLDVFEFILFSIAEVIEFIFPRHS